MSTLTDESRASRLCCRPSNREICLLAFACVLHIASRCTAYSPAIHTHSKSNLTRIRHSNNILNPHLLPLAITISFGKGPLNAGVVVEGHPDMVLLGSALEKMARTSDKIVDSNRNC
jgi:hypothetical protein